MRTFHLFTILLLFPALVLAGPSKSAKKALEARLVGHALTLVTPVHLYNAMVPITVVSRTRGIYYAAEVGGHVPLTDRDPEQLVAKIEALSGRTMRSALTVTEPGTRCVVEGVRWMDGGVGLQLVDDIGGRTAITVEWDAPLSKELAEADGLLALIADKVGRLE